MNCGVSEISNAVMIDSLDTIIQQENRRLEMDKNTGLLANHLRVSTMVQQSLKKNENTAKQNILHMKGLKSHSPKRSHSPRPSHSCDRVEEIERLANLFTQSPGFFTTNKNNNSVEVKCNKVKLKENMPTQTHNEFDNYKAFLNNKDNTNSISPNIKVKRNVRFGEYSPLNPANQVNSQPFLGFGEYDDKKKKMLELQKKEYIEYLSKVKQEKNTTDLPKLSDYSCEEALKTAMEDNNSSDPTQSDSKAIDHLENMKLAPFLDGVESCASDEDQIKETNRLKQELYRYELSKQIEEKKKLDQERKRKEQMEDEAIEQMAREQEEKIKKEYEKEVEKRTLAQLKKQLQQEKLKNEIMQKQKELESKSWKVPAETISRQVSKHVPSRHESFEENYDVEEFQCPPESTFDNVPLPTTRVRAPRKMVYDESVPVNRVTRDVSCNTEVFKNPCMNQNISPPVRNQKIEKAHVSFAQETPLIKNDFNPAALLPITKSVIIDSPLTLALAGLNDREDDGTCEAIEPTEATYRNQISKRSLGNNQDLSDKYLLSNLGSIRKQLDIEHQRLKQQVRRTQ